jgi:hypothetical protein
MRIEVVPAFAHSASERNQFNLRSSVFIRGFATPLFDRRSTFRADAGGVASEVVVADRAVDQQMPPARDPPNEDQKESRRQVRRHIKAISRYSIL